MSTLHRVIIIVYAACGLSAAILAAENSKPNIVFILADDLGFGDVHCNNSDSKIPTPNIDKLAAEGRRFTDAHSPSSVCTPTRYGILTGRYCWRTKLKSGVLLGYDAPLIEPGRMTVASLLKQNGYRSACIGKWHVGMDWALKAANDPVKEENIDFNSPIRSGPNACGFDYYFGISASLDMPPYVFIENDRVVAIPTGTMKKEGAVRAGALDPQFKTVDVLPELTQKAIQFISESREPFFLYLPLSAPHTPVVPPREFKGKSRAGAYGDFVVQVDSAVGEILRALDKPDLRKNTLVIFTSDNGSTNSVMKEFDHKPNGTYRGRKSDIWDGGHRVPFIARWPKQIPANTVCDKPVCLVDFLATCAHVVGARLPANSAEDSFSILPLLRGEVPRQQHPPIIHHSIDGLFAIRDEQWKLIAGRGSGGWDGKGKPEDPSAQLYNMVNDPEEKDNLYLGLLGTAFELKRKLTGIQENERTCTANFGNATLRGTVTLDGTPPESATKLIDMSTNPDCAAASGGTARREEIIANNGKLKNAVVYVQSVPEQLNYDDVSRPAVKMDQKGCVYTPHVLALMTNQPIRITNSDPLAHNVHMKSRESKEFGAPQRRHSLEPQIVKFDAPELGVPIQCDVHKWMLAYVCVFNHPFFAVTDENGNFEIKDFPPGEYTIATWHESNRLIAPSEKKVRISEPGEQKLEFTYKVKE